MDADHFDSLARSLHEARSRRGALTSLLGGTLGLLSLAEMAAKKKRNHAHGEGKGKKKKGKGKKKGRTPVSPPASDPPPPPPPCVPNCAGKVCGADGCGGSCGTCNVAGEICAQGQCVTGQGTCVTGVSSCPGPTVNCNGSTDCKCFQSASGATRCGSIPPGIQCGQCSTDAQCVGFGPGAFCVTQTAPGTNCSCGTAGQGFCIIPCDHTCPADCCAGVVCPTPDQCHNRGSCDPASGVCSNPTPKPNGASCETGNFCTIDTCQNGSCVQGATAPCTNPGPCESSPGTCNPATGGCSYRSTCNSVSNDICCPAGSDRQGTCGNPQGASCRDGLRCCSGACIDYNTETGIGSCK